jgi:hypothetical protein
VRCAHTPPGRRSTPTLDRMSQTSFDALAALLQHCDAVWRRMLTDAGEFYPFAAYVSPDGRVQALAADLGEKRTEATEVYQFLHGAIGQMAVEGRLIGYAIASNVTIPSQFKAPFTDGVRVHVETAGYSRDVYTPYRALPMPWLRRFFLVFRTIEYAEPITVDTPAHILGADAAV